MKPSVIGTAALKYSIIALLVIISTFDIVLVNKQCVCNSHWLRFLVQNYGIPICPWDATIS